MSSNRAGETQNTNGANDRVVLCVEDRLYRQYLENAFAGGGAQIASVEKEAIAEEIAEDPSGVLLLQSDSAEYNLIELSSRLKRLFGDDVRTLLLSSDYLMAQEAGSSFDQP